jgi:hypothetical protein
LLTTLFHLNPNEETKMAELHMQDELPDSQEQEVPEETSSNSLTRAVYWGIVVIGGFMAVWPFLPTSFVGWFRTSSSVWVGLIVVLAGILVLLLTGMLEQQTSDE